MSILDEEYTTHFIESIHKIDAEIYGTSKLCGVKSMIRMSECDLLSKIKKKFPRHGYGIEHIMFNIDDVDDKLEHISFTTRFFVYEFLFNEHHYDKRFEFILERDYENFSENLKNYYKMYFCGGIMCEIYKYLIAEDIQEDLQEEIQDPKNLNQIEAQILLLFFEDKKNNHLAVIKKVYSYIQKIYTNDEEFCKSIPEIWINYEIPIE